jgi:hypothetical protein
MNMIKYSAHRNYKIYHSFKLSLNYEAVNNVSFFIFFFPVPVCAITASAVPGGTCFYESFQYPVQVIKPVTGAESYGVNMTE